jgi:hypothetical protein
VLANFFADLAIRAIVERQAVGAVEEFYPLVSSSKAPTEPENEQELL